MLRKTALVVVFVFLVSLAACGGEAAAPAATLVQVTPLPTDTAAPPTDPPPTAETTAELQANRLWRDATDETIGETARWTNKVELADINGDGWIDLLFANGGSYDSPGAPLLSYVFLNRGPDQPYEDASEKTLGTEGMLARVIKVRDVNGDDLPDIMVGTTFQTQSRLFLGEGDGVFREVTATHLPQQVASVGDLEFGDVDADGDLDMVLADWGPGSPMANIGGWTMLWLNDGSGRFTDATEERMPTNRVRFSWELEFADVDNDYDLDILVSCKICAGSYLFENDGAGTFSNVSSERLPLGTNNYDFEAMDLNGDMYLDLVTVNDGSKMRERLFLNDRQGGFEKHSMELWPNEDNPPDTDDNMIVFFDFESDGDADFLIGALNSLDRVLLNDGHANLRLLSDKPLFTVRTRATLGIAVADLNGDDRMDIVEAQGEVSDAPWDEKVYFGQDISPDTAPPIISLVSASGDPLTVRARIHDNKSPTMPHDWQSVVVRWTGADGQAHETPLQWYGEYLWRATLEESPTADVTYQVCAVDAAGNEACSP